MFTQRRQKPFWQRAKRASNALQWGKLLLCALLLLNFVACRSQQATTVPAELVGTWRTDHPKYAGLFFQITPASLAFSMVEGTVENYTLTGYEQVQINTRNISQQVKHLLRGAKQDHEIELALVALPLIPAHYRPWNPMPRQHISAALDCHLSYDWAKEKLTQPDTRIYHDQSMSLKRL